jgi:protein disulfide-isomerase A6
MLPHLLAVVLALSSSFVSAALYPKDSLVKMIDQRGFRNAMKDNVCGWHKLIRRS